jgi:hypothetical protein
VGVGGQPQYVDIRVLILSLLWASVVDGLHFRCAVVGVGYFRRLKGGMRELVYHVSWREIAVPEDYFGFCACVCMYVCMYVCVLWGGLAYVCGG